jgi:hypothetical protein
MNEIITDYLDAKQLADRLTALELRSTSELARLEQERNEAREEAHRFRSLSYARSGIDKSASWFPWETSLNLAQKAQLLATEKHAK